MKTEMKKEHRDLRNAFILNFLAVVLGIIITFGGNAIIERNKEARNLNSCLELVSSELKEDLKWIDYGDSLLGRQVEAADFLARYENDYSKAPADSLRMMANEPLFICELSFYTDAFELLKNSGVLAKIDDQELALEIFQAYGHMRDYLTFFKMFHEHKKQYLEPAMNAKVTDLLAKDEFGAGELWSLISSSKEGKQFLREIQRFLYMYNDSETVASIKSTIDRIDAYIGR